MYIYWITWLSDDEEKLEVPAERELETSIRPTQMFEWKNCSERYSNTKV